MVDFFIAGVPRLAQGNMPHMSSPNPDLANPQATAVAKFPSLGELLDSLLLHFSLVKFARCDVPNWWHIVLGRLNSPQTSLLNGIQVGMGTTHTWIETSWNSQTNFCGDQD